MKQLYQEPKMFLLSMAREDVLSISFDNDLDISDLLNEEMQRIDE